MMIKDDLGDFTCFMADSNASFGFAGFASPPDKQWQDVEVPIEVIR
jgi:hypothetical protein